MTDTVFVVELLDYDDYPRQLEAVCSTRELADKLVEILKARWDGHHGGVREVKLDTYYGQDISTMLPKEETQ